MFSRLAMKAFLALSVVGGTFSTALPNDFRMTEIADPKDEYTGRFVEFYTDTGAGQTIGQKEGSDVYLVLASNGAATYNFWVKLTGETIGEDGFFIICRSGADFETWYPGKECDLQSGTVINSNGDDVYAVSLQ